MQEKKTTTAKKTVKKTTATAKKACATGKKACATRKPAACKKPAVKTRRITFTAHAEVGSRVFLAGSFNNWDAAAREMKDKQGNGIFTATVSLVPGTYQYKFVIDGNWHADRECMEWVQNEHGTMNSVVHVE